jgi:hypothetical protein
VETVGDSQLAAVVVLRMAESNMIAGRIGDGGTA